MLENPRAVAGNNSGIPIPSDRQEAVVWLVKRLTKLTNERLNIAHLIRDVRNAAKNDGYSAEELSLALKLGKMSPEARAQWRERVAKSAKLYGISVDVAEDDAKPAELLDAHLKKLRALASDRSDLSAEISETYKAAKDSEIDVPALKQIMRVSRLEPEDREEWFARLDNIGALAGFW